MDLILFLLLGGYLLIRCGLDKSASKAADNRTNMIISAKKRWVESVTNKKLEQDLKLFIERPENRDKVLEDVADVYDSILNGRRIDEFYPRSLWCKRKKDWTPEFHEKVQEWICRGDSRNALRIMMARRGYLTWIDAMSGSNKSIQTCSKLESEVVTWCGNELKRRGVIERFVAQPSGPYGRMSGIGWEIM